MREQYHYVKEMNKIVSLLPGALYLNIIRVTNFHLLLTHAFPMCRICNPLN